jgi:hypothetical protein
MTQRRQPPGFLTEDLAPRITGGPPRYSSRTEGPVVFVAITAGPVIGYLYANDDDDAAGWLPRRDATPDQQNLAAPWIRRLRDAKARGLAPVAALQELRGASNGRSAIARNAPGAAENLDALRAIASGSEDPWKET